MQCCYIYCQTLLSVIHSENLCPFFFLIGLSVDASFCTVPGAEHVSANSTTDVHILCLNSSPKVKNTLICFLAGR